MKNNESKREARHKRRVRNQIISYIILIILICLLAFVGYKGVRFLIDMIKSNAESSEKLSVSENEATVSEDEPQVIATPEYDLESISENEVEVSENSVENAAARTFVDSLTTEQKVASLFIVSPESITGVNTVTQAGEGTRTALSNYMVGGILYDSKNVRGAEDFKTMIQTTKDMYSELYGCDLWVAVNEEGAVNTIAGSTSGVTAEPAASEIGQSGDNNNAYTSYVNIGTYLADYDVDINLGPVCDISSAENSYIGNRAFSSDADIAASMVGNAVKGQQEHGISTCLKAFPGQGEASSDPKSAVVTTEKTLDDMKTSEFLPFESGINEGASMVMMSNIIAANATGESTPCSMSASMVNVLKEELGFEGIVVSGYLDENAVTSQYGQGEAAVMMINAGCDMLLRPSNFEEAYNGVLEAVNDGTISAERLDDALMKIYSSKFSN